MAACGLQADLDALASAFCPAGRRGYHCALYDALAGAVLLGSLVRQPQLASLTTMQLLALSTMDPKDETPCFKENFSKKGWTAPELGAKTPYSS